MKDILCVTGGKAVYGVDVESDSDIEFSNVDCPIHGKG